VYSSILAFAQDWFLAGEIATQLKIPLPIHHPQYDTSLLDITDKEIWKENRSMGKATQ
jgi:hypothetical protein